MKYITAILMMGFSLSSFALDAGEMAQLLSNEKIQDLQRMKYASISSITAERADGDLMMDNLVITITYAPQLTREEIRSSEGPGICVARVRYSYDQFSDNGMDLSNLEVLTNNCFQ